MRILYSVYWIDLIQSFEIRIENVYAVMNNDAMM